MNPSLVESRAQHQNLTGKATPSTFPRPPSLLISFPGTGTWELLMVTWNRSPHRGRGIHTPVPAFWNWVSLRKEALLSYLEEEGGRQEGPREKGRNRSHKGTAQEEDPVEVSRPDPTQLMSACRGPRHSSGFTLPRSHVDRSCPGHLQEGKRTP